MAHRSIVWLSTCLIFSSTICGTYSWDSDSFLSQIADDTDLFSDLFFDTNQLLKPLSHSDDTAELCHNSHNDLQSPLQLENPQFIHPEQPLQLPTSISVLCDSQKNSTQSPSKKRQHSLLSNTHEESSTIAKYDTNSAQFTAIQKMLFTTMKRTDCSVGHIRKEMKKFLKESLYPGIHSAALNFISKQASSFNCSAEQLNTIATILKLNALHQNVDLSQGSDNNSSDVITTLNEPSSQLYEPAFNTSLAASEAFFSNTDLTSSEIQTGIVNGMYHPSMIKTLDTRFRPTEFTACLNKLAESVTHNEKQKDILTFHYPNCVWHTISDDSKKQAKAIKVFQRWVLLNPNLQPFFPQPDTLNTEALLMPQKSPENNDSTHNNCSNDESNSQQPQALKVASNIIDQILTLSRTHTHQQCRELILQYLETLPDESRNYAYFVFKPLPVVRPIRRHTSSSQHPRENQAVTLKYSHNFASFVAQLYQTTEKCIREKIDLATDAHTFYEIIGKLRQNLESTETHITLAKLIALNKGVDLSKAPHQEQSVNLAISEGSQRATTILNTSAQAAIAFFGNKDFTCNALEEGMKAGMFHESMIHLFLKRNPGYSYLTHFFQAVERCITKEQYIILCTYYREIIAPSFANREDKKSIIDRLFNFHNKSSQA